MITSMQWAKSIKALLERHNLSIRGAAIKVGRPMLRTYLAQWLQGQIPQYKTAIDFLEHFPRAEAIICLHAGKFPVPDEWREGICPEDQMREIVYELRGGKKTPATDAAIRYLLEQILAEEALEDIYGEPEL